MRIEAANLHNLRDVSVNLPTGVLTVVTGGGRLGQELADPGLSAAGAR
jgi:excinuclease UvrABC ATPase subunit